MNALKQYMILKKKAESANQRADKAEGALEQDLKKLNSEFDCSSSEAGQKKLKSF